MNHETFAVDGGVPLKMWTQGVPVEEAARQQLLNLSRLPIVHDHIAVMPDVHYGIGATVGSVIATRRAIVPAAVGVDLGCGMEAVRTSLRASDLPDSLHALRLALEEMVPVGQAQHAEMDAHRGTRWGVLLPEYTALCDKHPAIVAKGLSSPSLQVATLGGGNHFVELCLDEEQRVWVMLHSGSRGIGNRIGQHFIALARETALKLDRTLPDKDLAWLDEGTQEFDDYVRAVGWAQKYAHVNRAAMMLNVLATLQAEIPTPFTTTAEVISCHHNYVEREHHFGEDVWLTRKGAVSARAGELGIIPGSMGAKSFIVRGKGNAESFHSCSHGAGRAMSRGQAKKRFTLEDHARDTAGVECRKDSDVLDETPQAYKSIDAVMAAQSELVDVVHTLKQVLCVKG